MTPRVRHQLSGTLYGRFLLAIRDAKDASQEAKLSRHRERPEKSSSELYVAKDAQIRAAVSLAADAKIGWGWCRDRAIDMWCVIFDLPTGQVSFHVVARGGGPAYVGMWDKDSQTSLRIDQAIELVSPRESRCPDWSEDIRFFGESLGWPDLPNDLMRAFGRFSGRRLTADDATYQALRRDYTRLRAQRQ